MKKITVLSILVLLAVMLGACGSSGLSKDVLDTTWEWQQLTETMPASQDPPAVAFLIKFIDETTATESFYDYYLCVYAFVVKN